MRKPFKSGRLEYTVYPQTKNIQLHHIKVYKKYRQTGRGHEMLNWLTDFADENGFNICLNSRVVNNDNMSDMELKQFFYKHGFEFAGIGDSNLMKRQFVKKEIKNDND